jgi:hypothetical protein
MFLSKRPSGIWHVFYADDLGKRQSVSTRCTYKCDALKFLQSFKLAECERKTRVQRLSLSEFIPAFIQHSTGIHTLKTVRSNRTALSEFLRGNCTPSWVQFQ